MVLNVVHCIYIWPNNELYSSGDPSVVADQVRKVIVCSGKHFFVLDEERRTRGITDTALIRLESLCPFPAYELQQEMAKYAQAKST